MTTGLPLRPMAVVVATLVTALLSGFLVGAFALEISADLGIGSAEIGRAVSAFFLTAALTSLAGGRIVDRVGARVGYRIGLGGVAMSGLTAGLLVRSGWHLVVALAICGAAIAFIDPSIARTITGSVTREHQGKAFGVKETAVAVASMTAGFALPLLAGRATWQVPFLAIAVVAIALAVVIPGGIDPGHRAAPSTPPLAVPAAPSTAPAATATVRRHRRTPAPITTERPGRDLALLAVSGALGGGGGAVVAIYLVTAGVSVGMTSGSAALLLSLGSLVSIGIRLAAGWNADRLPGGPLPLLAWMLVAGAVGVASLAVAASLAGASTEVGGTSGVVVALLAIGAVLALGPGWGWSALVFLVAVRLVPGRPAQASGAMLAGLGGGGAVFPLLAGILIERVGFVVTWTAAAVSMAIAAALAIVLQRRTQEG